MKVIIIEDKDARALLDSLELQKMKGDNILTRYNPETKANEATVADVHRAFHYVVTRWLRDQCAASGTPFWFKSFGEWAPSSVVSEHVAEYTDAAYDEELDMWCVGKARAGRILDGRTHDAMPEGWE